MYLKDKVVKLVNIPIHKPIRFATTHNETLRIEFQREHYIRLSEHSTKILLLQTGCADVKQIAELINGFPENTFCLTEINEVFLIDFKVPKE